MIANLIAFKDMLHHALQGGIPGAVVAHEPGEQIRIVALQQAAEGCPLGFLQAVDAGSVDAMSTGMRVRPRWAAEREGSIHDLACWEPDA